MSYLALYRRFRPAKLNDVMGQDHIVTVLKNQIETGKIGHAYLFCGPRGTGKTSVAKIFASAINCEHPLDGSPCGKCESCLALKDPANLDISEIDAASNNGVDEMRDLREKIQYPPVSGKYKVYIIDEVHMLSTGAFNALLKTLEEPPSHAVFILATTEVQKIPATILSRCMRFDFKLFPVEKLEELLKKVLNEIKKPYEDEAVSAIARAGAGSARDMLSVADTCIAFDDGKLTYKSVINVLGNADITMTTELCSAMLCGNEAKAIELTEKLLNEGKSAGLLLKDVMNFLNYCTIAKTCRDSKKILGLPQDIYDSIKNIVSNIDGHRIVRTMEIFSTAETELRYSLSPKIIFETAVLKSSLPQSDYDIESMISRINQLEKTVSVLKEKINGKIIESVSNDEETKDNISLKENELLENKIEKPLDDYVVEDNSYNDENAFPSDDYIVDFEESNLPPLEKKKIESKVEEKITEDVKKKEIKTHATANFDNAEATYGAFLRVLRKISRSGVLFTICMDMRNEFEGSKFVLYTDSDTVYKSLNKEEHRSIIEEAFKIIGITDYEIRFKISKKDDFDDRVNKIKERFQGVKINVK